MILIVLAIIPLIAAILSAISKRRRVGEAVTLAGALAMLSEFMVDWYAEGLRVNDAILKLVAGQSQANRAKLAEWIEAWSGRAASAFRPIAEFVLGESAGRRAGGAGPAFPRQLRHRGDLGGLRRVGRGDRGQTLHRHVRHRPLGPARTGPLAGSRSSRDQASLLGGDR